MGERILACAVIREKYIGLRTVSRSRKSPHRFYIPRHSLEELGYTSDNIIVHVQEICRKDPAFARCVMHPKKSLANCFKYINRQAKEYLKSEMEENGIEPENNGYGGDVPDGLCYQWAEDYFRDPEAVEDREKEDKFIPRPYAGGTARKKAAKTKSTAKKGGKKKQETDCKYSQISLEGIG